MPNGDPPEPGASSRPLVVLVVDDHLPLLAELPSLLERRAGFKVLIEATIEGALGTLADRAVDVVVADLRLSAGGGPDGGNLLDAVARWWPQVGRILSSVDSLGAVIAQECGHAWYSKDDPVSELVRLIREVSKR